MSNEQASGNLVTSIKAAGLSAAGEVLAKNAADTLHKHYPGHLWAVHVDETGGVMTVFNLMLSGRWGFLLKIKDIDPEMKKVMRAGGELLERYRVKRGMFTPGSLRDVRKDFSGNKVADHG